MRTTATAGTFDAPLVGQFAELQWTITQVRPDNYLLITTHGTINPSNLAPFVQAALAAARQCPYLLIDHRDLPEGFSPARIYDHPEQLEQFGLPPKFAAALVFPAPDPQTRFLDTRMANECKPVRVFHTLDQARIWLRSIIELG